MRKTVYRGSGCVSGGGGMRFLLVPRVVTFFLVILLLSIVSHIGAIVSSPFQAVPLAYSYRVTSGLPLQRFGFCRDHVCSFKRLFASRNIEKEYHDDHDKKDHKHDKPKYRSNAAAQQRFQSDDEDDNATTREEDEEEMTLLVEQHHDTTDHEHDQRPNYRSNLQQLRDAQARAQTVKNRVQTNQSKQQQQQQQQRPKSSTTPTSTSTRRTTITTAKSTTRQSITDYNIDSFLRGEYDLPFAEDAAAPTPGLTPGTTIELALKALRNLDYPELNHGAAVFMRFCAPLSRSDRWGGGVVDMGGWKELMRGALTPQMLTNRLGQSPDFSLLLEWDTLDVTEGMSVPNERAEVLGIGSTVAFVNAAFYVGGRFEIVQFTLKKVSGVWLIETAVLSKKEWFVQESQDS